MTKFGYLSILCVIIAAAAIVFAYRLHTKRIMKKIGEMIECAMGGGF